MVVREGGDVPGDSGAGLEDGRQVRSVQAGGLLASAVVRENGGCRVKGAEGVRVGMVSKEVSKARAKAI